MVTAEPEPAEYVEPPREVDVDLNFPLLFKFLEPWIEYIIEKILEVAHLVLEGIQNLWGATWMKIHEWVGKLWGLISDVTSQFWQWTYSQIRFLVDWAADEIPERVRGLLDASTTTLVSIMGAAEDAIGAAVGKLAPDLAGEWAARSPDAYLASQSRFAQYIYDAYSLRGQGELAELNLRPLREQKEVLKGWETTQTGLAATVSAPFEGLLDVVRAISLRAPTLAPVDVEKQVSLTWDAMKRLGGVALLAAGGLVGMALLGETIGFWKGMGLGQIAAIVWDASSFRLITGAILGALTWATIRQPLRYATNALLRPNLPDMRDITEMYAKKEITAPEFDQAMAYMGIPDDWLGVYHRYIWRDPRLFEVVRIAEIASPDPVPPKEATEWLTRAGMTEGIGPDWWYWMKFGKGAYDYLDIPILVNVAKMAVARREQTLYLTQIRRLARDGYIDATRTRTLLEAAWVPTPPIQFREAGIALEAEYEEKADLSTMLLMAFSRGLITEAECSQQLARLGMAGGIIATAIAREKLGLLARPAMLRVTPPEEGMAYPEVSEEIGAL